MVKNPPANAGDRGDAYVILDQQDPLEGGMATHSSIVGLENPMDRGAWLAAVHGVTKSQT